MRVSHKNASTSPAVSQMLYPIPIVSQFRFGQGGDGAGEVLEDGGFIGG